MTSQDSATERDLLTALGEDVAKLLDRHRAILDASSDPRVKGFLNSANAVLNAQSVAAAEESHFRSFTDQSPTLLIACNADGWADYFNHSSLKYTGLSRTELEGDGWLGCIHPDDLAGVREALAVAPDVDRSVDFRCRLLSFEIGEYRQHSGSVIPIRNSHGSVVRVFIALTDVEDHDGATSLLRAAMDAIPMPVLFLDTASRAFTFTNQAARWFLTGDPSVNSSADGMIKRYSCAEFDGEQAENSFDLLLRREPLYGVRGTWNTAAGPKSVLIHSHVLPPIEGSASIVVVAVQDISKLTITEEQLRAKEHELVRSNDSFQEFAYAVSHDLQEPLRMVSGYTELLRRHYQGKLDAGADEYFNYAAEGSARLNELIRDLLAFSRAGGSATRPTKQVNMNGALQWATLNLQAAIRESGARITHDDLPTIHGDEPRLAQLMQHLLSNALKFRSSKSLEVHVSCVLKGDLWEFVIADNGIGFEMRFAERIFGVFKRLHGNQFPGTGIGLAIARRIVETHGGQIWADSAPGEGTKFYFTLPS